ncbi:MULTISPECIES: hypothetical protein [unclassified Brevundimonas]|uniref:hypothetical protein n=1 Tax=unclassified Brevundimonas TaxID=2622653 RepID=UPI0025C3B32C|nr:MULTISPECIES: hypothetical protein [unclassified Brevundimonas]
MITFIAALVPTFLISRLLLWLTKAWRAGYARYVVVNLASGLIAMVLAAAGFANGGPPRWDAGVVYLAAQAVWLAVDLFAHRGRIAQKTKQEV